MHLGLAKVHESALSWEAMEPTGHLEADVSAADASAPAAEAALVAASHAGSSA
jgi:hypothetical protein